ncbi:MAG TPA: peptide chain release factor N(5)-glutamine methyltransferase [Gemmatimonadales bacterium]|nr:peptide chain release factor N(5)-glutamine methyltransferase [Gemmatimonadales bacterium]
MRDALAAATSILEGAGVAEARREAQDLYSSLVRRPASAAWLDREQPIPKAVGAGLQMAAERRAAGWPQAYAAGAACFRGHWLAVDRRVLIPRPETEGLVELALEWMQAAGRAGEPLVFADACTGSGAIAIALALEATARVRVVATDCSADALAVARVNVEALGVGDRVELRHGDLLEPLAGERVDAVVANPPYVAAAEWNGLEPGVRNFEPHGALVSGADGLDAIRALLAQARAALRPGGLLALEVDARRAGDAAALAAARGFASCTVLQDLFGRPRYLRARRPDGGD